MRYSEAQMTSELLDQPEFTGLPRKIFICSTPRSGSYMLCRFMINAGLGVPHEYFNPVIMRQIAPRLDPAIEFDRLKWRCRGLRDRLPFGNADRAAEIRFLENYISALIPRRCQGGIFAAKIHFDQYVRVLDNPVGRTLLDGGLFIYLFREDLLQQAVSRNFAYVTGRWGIDDAVTTAPVSASDLLNVKGIDRELETLADEDRGWRVFLARNGLSPISVSYEQLCKEPFKFVATIADRIGIDPGTLDQGYTEPASPTARKGDPSLPSKEEVVRRYLATVRSINGLSSEMPGAPEGHASAQPGVAAE
jgi:LPS sulfotransferase NodH